MTEGYGSAIGRHLFIWSGWVFTVGGAVASLTVGAEYTWIGALFVVTGLLALGTHSWRAQQQLGEAERKHQKEQDVLRQQTRDETARREQAEKRLAEVPADALSRLASLVSEGVLNELIGLLREQADLLGRVQLFAIALTKPLNVRSFQKISGELYVLARGLPAALVHLRPGDPFVLIRRNEAGIEITAARVVVHQPIESGGEIVTFRVVAAVADDITHLTGLAGERAVEGIKGYGLALGVELTGIPALDFSQVAQAIPHLAAGSLRQGVVDMIQTNVARIIDPTRVVLSVGTKDGATEGMEFIIYDLSDRILDPETKEDLGQIELVKGRVIAVHVQEKLTVAVTKTRRVERTIPGILPAGLDLINPRKITETVQDELKVEGSDPLPQDPVVRVGDRVRSVSQPMSRVPVAVA